jgi:hypothetical protein
VHPGISAIIVPGASPITQLKEPVMGKGMDRKKEDKKKPAKSMMEKRAAKQAKRADKAFKTG